MISCGQRGVSLYITIILLAIILSVALGLGALFVNQLRLVTSVGNSVIALYAADTGIEETLKGIYLNIQEHKKPCLSGTLENTAQYKVEVSCCNPSDETCTFKSNKCPLVYNTSDCPKPDSNNCDDASYFCVRSEGSYNNTRRVLEANF